MLLFGWSGFFVFFGVLVVCGWFVEERLQPFLVVSRTKDRGKTRRTAKCN